MNSSFLTLNIKDILNGLVVVVLTAILDSVVQLMGVPGFSFYHFDWNTVLTTAIVAGAGYLSKKLLSDQKGSFGGVL